MAVKYSIHKFSATLFLFPLNSTLLLYKTSIIKKKKKTIVFILKNKKKVIYRIPFI